LVQFTKLHLSGFKSFVDGTDLLVLPGVSAVVGPNGCGKSNLIEALRWVMGENSAKRMRGGEMDDVIFAGNVTRPARNVAEVTVELDNRDRKAPALFNDTDNLQIVRRIDRGQGSSYSINGKEVRARDVQLLFADSATGAHSTALVSQGRVGALINAKPKDRRTLLEEAAGITGLHSRRHEAELRLRAAETNLERLDDVISTLETQLQGLKKQARQATRYRNIADQIRRTDALALHLEAEAGKTLVAEAQEKLQALEAEVAEATQKAGACAQAQAEAAAALPALREREAAAAAALQKLLIDRDALEREEAQTAEARRQAAERLDVLGRDRARAQNLAEEADAADAQLAAESKDLTARLEREESDIGEARGAFESARQAVQAQEESCDALARSLAADEAGASALRQKLAELAQRLEKLEREAGQTKEQLSQLASGQEERGELARCDQRILTLEAELETAREALAAAEMESDSLNSQVTRLQESAAEKDAALSRLEAEAAALTIRRPSFSP
jgi:chromosome segregation protein